MIRPINFKRKSQGFGNQDVSTASLIPNTDTHTPSNKKVVWHFFSGTEHAQQCQAKSQACLHAQIVSGLYAKISVFLASLLPLAGLQMLPTIIHSNITHNG